jgi:MoaA/NifB/PqqE/SkfB family radical SAM enzyme
MCDSWEKPTAGDMTLEQIQKVYEQLPRMPIVRLTGGEPWFRRDFPDILRAAEEILKPRFLHVTTNGFLTDRILETVSNPARKIPLDVLVSLDGVGEKHNAIRGNSRAFDMCMRTLRELAEHRDEWNVRVAVNQTVVDPEGAEHYYKLRDLLKPLGVHVHLIMAYSQSATYSAERETNVAPVEVGSFDTFGEFSDEMLTTLFDAFEKDLEAFDYRERIAKRYYLERIRNRLLHERGSPNPACVALSSHLRIFPNGDVPTCQMNSEVVGNLCDEGFDQVWYGARALANREWVTQCAGCWAECEVLPSAVFTLDLALPARLRSSPRSQPQDRSDASYAGPHGEPSGGRDDPGPQLYNLQLPPARPENSSDGTSC